MKNGKIGVTTENIFPVIKKFLYSEHEIFLRELISNAVDADGNPANLRQIDFVKIQTGVNCKAGNNVGEISTEVCGVGCYRTVTQAE